MNDSQTDRTVAEAARHVTADRVQPSGAGIVRHPAASQVLAATSIPAAAAHRSSDQVKHG